MVKWFWIYSESYQRTVCSLSSTCSIVLRSPVNKQRGLQLISFGRELSLPNAFAVKVRVNVHNINEVEGTRIGGWATCRFWIYIWIPVWIVVWSWSYELSCSSSITLPSQQQRIFNQLQKNPFELFHSLPLLDINFQHLSSIKSKHGLYHSYSKVRLWWGSPCWYLSPPE